MSTGPNFNFNAPIEHNQVQAGDNNTINNTYGEAGPTLDDLLKKVTEALPEEDAKEFSSSVQQFVAMPVEKQEEQVKTKSPLWSSMVDVITKNRSTILAAFKGGALAGFKTLQSKSIVASTIIGALEAVK